MLLLFYEGDNGKINENSVANDFKRIISYLLVIFKQKVWIGIVDH